jgi:hypothetical protein
MCDRWAFAVLRADGSALIFEMGYSRFGKRSKIFRQLWRFSRFEPSFSCICRTISVGVSR